MPGLSGFQVVERLPAGPLVVFTTAYDQHAVQAFEANAFDYLLKPIEPGRLDRTLDRVANRRDTAGADDLRAALERLAKQLRGGEFLEHLASRMGDRVQLIGINQVTHVVARERATFAATATGEHILDVTIAELERKLDPAKFFRIHRGTLVNLSWLGELHADFGGRLLIRLARRAPHRAGRGSGSRAAPEAAPRPALMISRAADDDRRIIGILAVTLLAYYLLTLGGHHYSKDGVVMFQSAKQLLFQGSLRLDPPVVWMSPIRTSIFGIGMTLAYLPLLLIWWPMFHRFPGYTTTPYDPALPFNPALYSNLAYLLCSVLNPMITAATACVVFRVARLFGLSRAWSLVAAVTYGVASPAAVYARYDYAQPLAGLALTLAAWQLLEARRRAALRPYLASGLCLAYGILTRPEILAVAVWAVIWVWIADRRQPIRSASDPCRGSLRSRHGRDRGLPLDQSTQVRSNRQQPRLRGLARPVQV